MSLPELRALNDLMKNSWTSFVENAPGDWKEDNWLTDRKPVGIIAIYGQNQPIITSGGTVEDEIGRWRRSHDYSQARWLSYAAATHYEYEIHSDIVETGKD